MTNPASQICPYCKATIYPTPTQQCPICGQALAPVPIKLEYQAPKIEFTLESAFNNGWYAMKKNMGILVGGTAIWFFIHMIFSLIPFISMIYALFFSTTMMSGLFLLGLHAVRNQNPQIGDIFGGFQRFGRTIGAGLLNMLIVLACFAPVLLALPAIEMMRKNGPNEALELTLIFSSMLISIAICVPLMIRWSLTLFFIMDNNCTGVIDAFNRSAKATKGARLKLLGYGIVIMLIAEAGFLACCVGIIFTLPMGFCMSSVIYEALKHKANETPAA